MDPELIEALRRGSGIGLRGDGTFTFRERPVEHPRVQALFHRGVRMRADGEVVLEVGGQWCFVACEGMARFVEAVRAERGGLVVRFAGGEELRVSAAICGYGPDDRLYLWSEEAAGPALLQRGAHQAVLAHLGEDLVARFDGAEVVVVRLARVPARDEPPPARDEAPVGGG